MKKYLVGGAIRDKLMGKPATDMDYVVVGATEDQMLTLGYKKVGADFPVFMDEAGDQYALARTETKNGIGYNGFAVHYNPYVSLADDLGRRDLTVNAIAMDLDTSEIVDPYNGKADMDAKVLRHVSDAFSDDPLRVVRLARFFARWPEFTIAPNTEILARNIVQSGEMDSLSDERFWAEMEKMFEQSIHPHRFFEALQNFGVMNKVKFFTDLFGFVSKNTIDNVFATYSKAVTFVPQEDKLTFFVALASNRNAKQESVAIPTRVKKLTSNMKIMLDLSPSRESLFSVFTITKAFGESKDMPDVIRTMAASEDFGGHYHIKSADVGYCLAMARSVCAAMFPDKTGKALGYAINEERIAVISRALEELHESR